MTTPEGPSDSIAEVISLDQVREKLRPKQSDCDAPELEPEYVPAEYPEFLVVQKALARLTGTTKKDRFLLLTKETSDIRKVDVHKFGKVEYLLIDINTDDMEALTIDLEQRDEATEARLKPTLKRMYIASLVANHVYRKAYRIDCRADVSAPVVGTEDMNIDKETEQSRWKDITTWRAAAGIAMLAVGENRPSLRRDMREHLIDVLENRLAFMTSEALYEELTGISLPEEDMDWLIGICNPLNKFDLKRVDKRINGVS